MMGALPPSACGIADGTVVGIHGGSGSRCGDQTAGNARPRPVGGRYKSIHRPRPRAQSAHIGPGMLQFPLDSDTTSEAQAPRDGSAMKAKLSKAE